MKYPIIKCTLWHYIRRSSVAAVAMATLLVVTSAYSQDRKIPPVGGGGGGEFVARCPAGQVLGGVELRVGDDVDGIRPLCRKPSARLEKVQQYDPKNPFPSVPKYVEEVRYDLGEAIAAAGLNGGPGGGVKTLVCGLENGILEPVVTGIYVEAEGEDTVVVNRITLLCESVSENGLPTAFRGVEFWRLGIRKNFEAPRITNGSAKSSKGTSLCPVSRDNFATVAVGIHGRSGIWLDALGLICDEPKFHLLPRPMSLGRVKTSTGVPSQPICESARAARARNSPAAPGLEAQCRAAGAAGEIAPKALGRVKITPTDAPPISICDSARGARARNSPAAPGLEAQCRSSLAATGAVIAVSDPTLVQARTVETDVFYQQGFDIATAIFGDPSLGARGNTATGPGSLGIRDVLSAAGQRGFNASVKLHLSRDYTKPAPVGPIITAATNPVIVPNGQPSGSTIITWKTPPEYTYCEIYLSVDDGQWSEFARGPNASKQATIKPGSSYSFRMMVYEGQAGTPKIITTLTVTAKNN